jgi:uncharacterized repeat protein (TIGR03803 family)
MRLRPAPPISSLIVLAITVIFAPHASASTETVLHSFDIKTGYDPYGGVVFDQAGNLYGATFYGGSVDCNHNGCGMVYELSPNADGTWSEQTIYTFTGGPDGSHPYSSLVFDAAGNLYGTTYGNNDGGSGVGTAFRLTPGPNGTWQFSLLHTFAGGKDGARPYGLLAIDNSGNLYGTTDQGGSHNAGIAFELSPASGAWTETLLHTFTGGQDGSYPIGLLVAPGGNLYGAAAHGGLGYGVIFELSKSSNGTWKDTVLYSLTNVPQGASPTSLALDAAGNIYAATAGGGSSQYCYGGCGMVFRLSPQSNGTYKYTPLHSFNGGGGDNPSALILDTAGNLYGATYSGGNGMGLIFELNPNSNWDETVIYEFVAAQGGEPVAPLTFDASGNLYGTAVYGGAGGGGVVFEVTP